MKERVNDLEQVKFEDDEKDKDKKIKRNKISFSPNDKKRSVTKSKYKNIKSAKIDSKKSGVEVDDEKCLMKNVKTKRNPSMKMKTMIDAFEENMVMKNGMGADARKERDEKLVGKTDEDGDQMKNAFERMMKSAQGGNLKFNSPGRKRRKRIGSLKTPGKAGKNSTLEEWLMKI